MTDVELVKSKIDIVSFLSDYITLKKAGRNFKALCPFHSEKTPSFVVSPERQSWHCFGGCGEGGDAISFLEKWENLEFLEALRILAKKVGVTLSNYIPSSQTQLKDRLIEANHLASEFYHYLLVNHKVGKRAREYLESRHIKNETIKTFMLGYAPESWDSLLKYLLKKGYQTGEIHQAGLAVKSDRGRYYDRFRGRLMFTLCDHRGNVIGFSGRLLNEEVYPERERGAKYVNTAETPVYIKGNTLYGLHITKEAVKKEKEAVLVEGEFDMLSSFQAGRANVCAIKGSALTEGQLLLLKRYTENLILALDSDFAGSEAAKRGIEAADLAGFTLKVAKLPYGKDPADCIEKDPHLWKQALKGAVPIYDFIIQNALEKYDRGEVFGKKKIGSEVIPFLAKITNPIIISHYTKKLAKELEVTEESIETSIRQFAKEKKMPAVAVSAKVQLPRNIMLEEYLLSLIIQSKEPQKTFDESAKILSTDDFASPAVAAIFHELEKYFKKHEQFNIKIFGKSLPPELVLTFDKAYLVDINQVLSDDKHFQKELSYTAKNIKVIGLRRRINDLSTKIKQLGKEEEQEETGKLQEIQRQLIKEIDELDKSS